MAKKMSKSQKKVGKVMKEFKAGKLHSGKKGPVVKNRKQAVAIALSEAGQSKKMMSGGLSGNQFKIDINKDGKISGEDFKMLKTKNKKNGGMSDGQATKGFGIEKKRGGGIATRGMGLALRGGGMAQRGTGMALKDGGSVNEHKRMAMGKKII